MTASRPRVRASIRPTSWASVEQRTNALINAAREAAERPKRQPPGLDWDAMIANLKKMLDGMDDG